MWFLEEGGQSGVVKDVRKALQYAALLNSQPGSQLNRFEVVQVVTDDAQSNASGKLLGFDLSSGFSNSLLWWWGPEPRVGDSPSLGEPIRTLGDLVYRFYGPQRNENGLFPTVAIASGCLSAMDALQHLCPDLFESEDLRSNFRPVGLYLVPPDERNGPSR